MIDERLFQIFFCTRNADEILHHFLQVTMNGIRTLRAGVGKGSKQFFFGLLDLRVVEGRSGSALGVFGGRKSGATPEDQEIGERIPAEAIRTVKTCRGFALRT